MDGGTTEEQAYCKNRSFQNNYNLTVTPKNFVKQKHVVCITSSLDGICNSFTNLRLHGSPAVESVETLSDARNDWVSSRDDVAVQNLWF